MNKDRVKVSCFVIFIACVLAILLTADRASQTAHASSSGPPIPFTDAPGESNCTVCHGGVPNKGPGQFAINAPETYVPGQMYQVTVSHTTGDASRLRWGFLLTALTADNNRAGTIQQTPNTFVQDDSGPGGNRQYTGQNSTGTFEGQSGGASWTFDWIAPATDVGPVTFYSAGNQANGDHTNDGDQIYTSSLTIDAVCATISPAGQFFGHSGGTGHVTVSGELGCKWSAVSNDTWIVIVSDTGGDISFEVRENFTASARLGTLSIGGRTFTVVQDGGLGEDCEYFISPSFQSFPANGGTSSVQINASERCAWQAVADVSWITITSVDIGVGNGTVTYTVAANPAPGGRKGKITVAGKVYSVKQKGL